MSYPRYVTPDFKRFDPLELAQWTERIVGKYEEGRWFRKYDKFSIAGVYRGISTGYAVGCCLRCVFCWVSFSRDFPEKYGRFYSAEEAFRIMSDNARKRGIRKLRISGGEPTLVRGHLLQILDLVEESEFPLFILETNGILFGADKSYVQKISRYEKVHVRVSLKAGTPEEFAKKTGAKPEAFELPFKAIEHLLDFGVSFHVAAMIGDPRIVTVEERSALIERLAEIDKRLLFELEEEVVDPYSATLRRLELAGYKLEWPLRRIYVPVSRLLREGKV